MKEGSGCLDFIISLCNLAWASMGNSPYHGQSDRPLLDVHVHFPYRGENKVLTSLDRDFVVYVSRLLYWIRVSLRCLPWSLGIVLACDVCGSSVIAFPGSF